MRSAAAGVLKCTLMANYIFDVRAVILLKNLNRTKRYPYYFFTNLAFTFAFQHCFHPAF